MWDCDFVDMSGIEQCAQEFIHNIGNGLTMIGANPYPEWLSTYQWLSARLQYLQCISNGDTAVLHQAIDI